MMKWITSYIEKNKMEWEYRDRIGRKRKEETRHIEQPTEAVRKEENRAEKETDEEKKQKRIELAKVMKERWRAWRKN